MPQIEVLYAGEGFALACCGSLFVTVLRLPVTGEGLREMRKHIQRHHDKNGGQVAGLTVIEPSAAQAAPKEVREESAGLTKDFQGRASAIVIEGDGFRAGATRAFVAAIYLVNRPRFPNKIFANVDDAVTWLKRTTAQLLKDIPPEQQHEAVDKARASITTPPRR
jgi:hypothetical protein